MKIIRIFFLFIFILTIASCNSDKKQIIKVAQGYLDATGNYRIEEAYQYASKQTQETTLPYITDYIMPVTDTAFLASNVPATIDIDSLVIGNDTAWVAYTKKTPIKRLNNIICLIKEEGRWVVDVPLVVPQAIKVGADGTATVFNSTDSIEWGQLKSASDL